MAQYVTEEMLSWWFCENTQSKTLPHQSHNLNAIKQTIVANGEYSSQVLLRYLWAVFLSNRNWWRLQRFFPRLLRMSHYIQNTLLLCLWEKLPMLQQPVIGEVKIALSGTISGSFWYLTGMINEMGFNITLTLYGLFLTLHSTIFIATTTPTLDSRQTVIKTMQALLGVCRIDHSINEHLRGKKPNDWNNTAPTFS